jgi:hypothetical protein
MSQAGLMPLIAAWLREQDTPVVGGTGPAPPPPPPRAPFELRAPSMYTPDVPRPAYPAPPPDPRDRNPQPPPDWARTRAALRSQAEPSMGREERVAGPIEPLVAGGGKALYHVGKAATQGVGPVLRELARLGWVREPLIEAGKSRLGLGTKSAKEETRATTDKLRLAERAVQDAQATQGPAGAVVLPKPASGLRPSAGRAVLHPGEFTPGEQQLIEDILKKPGTLRPDFRQSEKLYEQGKYGQNFYHDIPPVFERRLQDPRDVQQAMKYQTSGALGSEPRAQAELGLEALRREKLGLPLGHDIFEVAKDPKTGKAYAVDAKLRNAMLAQFESIRQGGSPSGPKLTPYGFAMGGDPTKYPMTRDPSAYVMDRHMWDIHYGRHAAKMPQRLDPRTGLMRDTTGRDLETDVRRMLSTHEGRERAKAMGIEAGQFQAGQWFGKRGTRGPTEDVSMADIIVNAIRRRPDDFAKIPGWTRLNEDGQAELATKLLMAGGTGAAIIINAVRQAHAPPPEEGALTQKVFGGGR